MNFRVSTACTALALLFIACGKTTKPAPHANPGAPAAPAISSSTSSPKPIANFPVNVVWILLDACRPDHLSCYGYSRPTSPNIDAVAARGARFEQNFAQGPATLLSVESYMTGRYTPAQYQDARHLGLWFLHTPQPGEKLASTIFHENGYTTAMFSASPWYSKDSRLGKSFDTFTPLTYEIDKLGRLNFRDGAGPTTFESLNPDLMKWIAARGSQPFFLYVHSLDTHQPHLPPYTKEVWVDQNFPAERDKAIRWWTGAPFTEAERQRINDLYDGGVLCADDTVGTIVAALDKAKVLDKTLVIIGSDHGEALAEDLKTVGHPDNMSYDELLHTPLIMAGPGIPAGKKVAVRTENADIVPTLIDLLGLKTDAKFDGVSERAALLDATPKDPHEYTYARTSAYYFSTEPNRVFRFDNSKFEISPFPASHFKQSSDGKPMYVWAMPDRIGQRKEIEAPAAQLSRAQELVRTKFGPDWAAHEAQPIETPPYFETAGDQVLVVDPKKNPVAETDDPKDNLWARKTSPYLWRFEEQTLLISHPYSEHSPGLICTQKVPPGRYHVSVFTRTLDTDPDRGASFSIYVPIPEEKGMRKFGVPPAKPGQTNKDWIEIGTYTVGNDGVFTYWLEEGYPHDVAVIGGLRFVAVGHEDAVQSSDEEKERLEALGYAETKAKQ